MKSIKKTLIAGALACAAFNAHADEDSFSYGIKVGGGFSSAVRYSENATINDRKVESTFFDILAVYGALYGEYAMTDYVGIGAEAGYGRKGASLIGEKKEGDKNESSISMVSHGISAGVHLYFYPFGRDMDPGIFKVMLGGVPFYPFSTTYKNGDKELPLTDDQKKEEAPFNIFLTAGLGYELLCGFSVEASYSHGLMNRFNLQDGKEQTIFSNVKGLKDLYTHDVTIGMRYNVASLYSAS